MPTPQNFSTQSKQKQKTFKMSLFPSMQNSQTFTFNSAEPEVVSHPKAEWNNYRTCSSRGQLLRDLIATGMPENHARKQVDKDFAARGRRRSAIISPPTSPTSPMGRSPIGDRPSANMTEGVASRSPTRNESPWQGFGSSYSEPGAAPRARSPRPY